MGRTVFKSMTQISLISFTLMATVPSVVFADATDTIISAGIARQKAAKSSQARIDKIFEQTEKIISKAQQQSKVIDGLKIYNDQMRRTLDAQKLAMTKLETSIEEASLIERQIVPLMMRMIAGLEDFVNADIPFKLTERKERIQRIKSYLTNANISPAERFRQVLEAYSTESGYGTSIDVYTDTLAIDGNDMTVNVLQVGRTVMYYQTTDEKQSGYFDRDSNAWQTLSGGHNEGISKAIKIAQKKKSPDLMLLPIPAPKEV